jgi:hypothetical protein
VTYAFLVEIGSHSPIDKGCTVAMEALYYKKLHLIKAIRLYCGSTVKKSVLLTKEALNIVVKKHSRVPIKSFQ